MSESTELKSISDKMLRVFKGKKESLLRPNDVQAKTNYLT